ncbi:hypothetical protein U9M48_020787 [Paspalum notatum var. saurae]|uniref:Uncharacterized protein n=1 Tax=Paspalum notatum var. saurae TaxID=547442 RepID=A0AAQ3TJ08_PASNO
MVGVCAGGDSTVGQSSESLAAPGCTYAGSMAATLRQRLPTAPNAAPPPVSATSLDTRASGSASREKRKSATSLPASANTTRYASLSTRSFMLSNGGSSLFVVVGLDTVPLPLPLPPDILGVG